MPAMSQITAIANMSAMGLSQRDIASKLNLNKSKVQRVLQDDQCRNILDQTIRIYIAHAKAITKRFLQLCYHSDPKISLDAIKHYNQVTGIAPSHTGNTVLMQIYQDNRSLITPDAARLLGMLSDTAAGDATSQTLADDVVEG